MIPLTFWDELSDGSVEDGQLWVRGSLATLVWLQHKCPGAEARPWASVPQPQGPLSHSTKLFPLRPSLLSGSTTPNQYSRPQNLGPHDAAQKSGVSAWPRQLLDPAGGRRGQF